MDTTETIHYPPLDIDARAHVCVIGAGIAGMTTAYLLARAGKNVIVIDNDSIGGGETSRTTANICNALDDYYSRLEKLFGEDGSRLAAESHTAAIAKIEDIVELEAIDCGFQRFDGYLFLDEHHTREMLDEELAAAHRAGLVDTSIVERAPLDAFDTGSAIRFPRQAQFHILRYLNGLARAITRDGGSIYCNTRAKDIEDGVPAKVTTGDGHTIIADDIVVATNSPVNDWMVMHTKQAAYRTYVVGLRVRKGAISRIMLWDTGMPYHYVSIHSSGIPDTDYEVLLVGGEDHRTGQANDADERFARIEAWARKRFPMTQDVMYRWSGQLLQPVDGLAFLGKNPGPDEHIYIITGDSGNGITHGTIGAMLITDLVCGRENPWRDIYDPARISLRSAPNYAKENLNVAEQYSSWLTPGDVGSVEEIPNDSGAVIRRGMHKIAAYRDSHGNLIQHSAVCTHLHCIVDWNDTEKTWDCPCHGSRYDPYGKVVNGPAIADLNPAPE
jgi:glycine/D-amino acid oxidase-like deaminating enzyme/nitrite reductase/ring-hydroxylating ferredoxin subunit